jgi:hypothetical protein
MVVCEKSLNRPRHQTSSTQVLGIQENNLSHRMDLYKWIFSAKYNTLFAVMIGKATVSTLVVR